MSDWVALSTTRADQEYRAKAERFAGKSVS